MKTAEAHNAQLTGKIDPPRRVSIEIPRAPKISKAEFVRRCCEMMEIDASSTLTYSGIVDLLEEIYENRLKEL